MPETKMLQVAVVFNEKFCASTCPLLDYGRGLCRLFGPFEHQEPVPSGRYIRLDACFEGVRKADSYIQSEIFVHEEYNAFPIVVHDDMLDGLARIRDPEFDMRFPKSRRHYGPLQKTADAEYDELNY